MTTVMKTNFTLTALESALAFSALFGVPCTVEKLYKELEKNKRSDLELFEQANALELFKISENSDIASILAKMLGNLEVSYYELCEHTIGDDQHGVYAGIESYFKKKLGLNSEDSMPNYIDGDIENIGWETFIKLVISIHKTHSTVEHDLNELVDSIRKSIADNKKHVGADAGLFDFTIDNWACDLLLGQTLVGFLMNQEDYATEVNNYYFIRYSGGLDLGNIDIHNTLEHQEIVMELDLDESTSHRFTFEDLRNAKPINNTSWEVTDEDGELLTLSFYEVTPLELN